MNYTITILKYNMLILFRAAFFIYIWDNNNDRSIYSVSVNHFATFILFSINCKSNLSNGLFEH
jgi:hypothetical protein